MEVKEKVERYEITDILCDVCNQSCTKDYHRELAILNANWGYGSEKDGQGYECHMCEGCYDKVVAFIESIGGKVRQVY